MVQQPNRRRFDVHEYHQMGRAGILTEDDRVELIEGEIVEMPPIGSRHAASVDRLTNLFATRAAGAAIVRVQNPIRIDEYGEPQPDIALVRPRADFYATRHPVPSDILLVVEVADTTVGYDRSVKIPLYAKANIPESWLADLDRDLVELHREPTAEGYRSVRVARRGERISPLALPDVGLRVDEILG